MTTNITLSIIAIAILFIGLAIMKWQTLKFEKQVKKHLEETKLN